VASRVTAWNPARVPTFDLVRYVEDGAQRVLSFEEFSNLPIDARVSLLLIGKPRFYKGNVQISKTRALARQG
jgi:hypothetical protein